MACLVTYHAIILHWKYFWWYLLISKVAYLLTLNICYFWYLVWGADHLQTLFSKILAHYGKRERDRFWELCSYPNSHNDFLWVGLRTTHGYSYSRLVLSWKWKSVLCQIHKGTNMSPQLLRGQSASGYIYFFVLPTTGVISKIWYLLTAGILGALCFTYPYIQITRQKFNYVLVIVLAKL